jgi:hypothetical protein
VFTVALNTFIFISCRIYKIIAIRDIIKAISVVVDAKFVDVEPDLRTHDGQIRQFVISSMSISSSPRLQTTTRDEHARSGQLDGCTDDFLTHRAGQIEQPLTSVVTSSSSMAHRTGIASHGATFGGQFGVGSDDGRQKLHAGQPYLSTFASSKPAPQLVACDSQTGSTPHDFGRQ